MEARRNVLVAALAAAALLAAPGVAPPLAAHDPAGAEVQDTHAVRDELGARAIAWPIEVAVHPAEGEAGGGPRVPASDAGGLAAAGAPADPAHGGATIATSVSVRGLAPVVTTVRAWRDPAGDVAYVLFHASDRNGRADLVAADAEPARGVRLALVEVTRATTGLPVGPAEAPDDGTTRAWLATLRFDGADGRVRLAAEDRTGFVAQRLVAVGAAVPDVAASGPTEARIDPTPLVLLLGAALFGRQRR